MPPPRPSSSLQALVDRMKLKEYQDSEAEFQKIQEAENKAEKRRILDAMSKGQKTYRKAANEGGVLVRSTFGPDSIEIKIFQDGVFGCFVCKNVYCSHIQELESAPEAGNRLLNVLINPQARTFEDIYSDDYLPAFIFAYSEEIYIPLAFKWAFSKVDGNGIVIEYGPRNLVEMMYAQHGKDKKIEYVTLDGWLDLDTDNLATIRATLNNHFQATIVNQCICISYSHFRISQDATIKTLEDAASWTRQGKCLACERYSAAVSADDLIPVKEKNFRAR